MDIFWGHMDRLTTKVDEALTKQTSELQLMMKTFDNKSEKI